MNEEATQMHQINSILNPRVGPLKMVITGGIENFESYKISQVDHDFDKSMKLNLQANNFQVRIFVDNP